MLFAAAPPGKHVEGIGAIRLSEPDSVSPVRIGLTEPGSDILPSTVVAFLL